MNKLSFSPETSQLVMYAAGFVGSCACIGFMGWLVAGIYKHHVTIPMQNLRNQHLTDLTKIAAALLSEHYIQNRAVPDKAIDLIDEAGAKAQLSSQKNIGESEIVHLMASQLKLPMDTVLKQYEHLKQKQPQS